jgi:hypothetical protein
MNIRNLISNFIKQVCEQNFSQANQTLDTIVTEKVKTRIKKTAEKQKAVKGAKKVTKKVTKKNK